MGVAKAPILFKESVVADRPMPFEFKIRSQVLRAPNLHGIGMTSEELCPFLDRSQLRAMGRSAAVIMHLAHACGLRDRLTSYDPGRIGLYLLGHQGPTPFAILKEYHESPTPRWASVLRKRWPPKALLQTGRLMAVAHLGVFLRLRGPMLAVGRFEQALDLAITDFEMGRTDLAILVSALSLDDPLDELSIDQLDLERHECGVLVGLSREGMPRSLPISPVRPVERRRYGIADALMRFGAEVPAEESP